MNFVIGILISITLGMILYIVLFELLPHVLHGEKKMQSFVGVLIGVILIIVSSMFE